jgi:hypothetical protein
MLNSFIIWDDWGSSIGEADSCLLLTGDEGIVFNSNSYFNNNILPNSAGISIGDSQHFFYDAHINSIITD